MHTKSINISYSRRFEACACVNAFKCMIFSLSSWLLSSAQLWILIRIICTHSEFLFLFLFSSFVNCMFVDAHNTFTEKPYRLVHVKHKLRNQRSVRDVIHLRLNNNNGMNEYNRTINWPRMIRRLLVIFHNFFCYLSLSFLLFFVFCLFSCASHPVGLSN